MDVASQFLQAYVGRWWVQEQLKRHDVVLGLGEEVIQYKIKEY
jgi:hypothetical protein